MGKKYVETFLTKKFGVYQGSQRKILNDVTEKIEKTETRSKREAILVQASVIWHGEWAWEKELAFRLKNCTSLHHQTVSSCPFLTLCDVLTKY